MDRPTGITRIDRTEGQLSPERWRRVEELYHEAQSRPAAEQEGFLREACAGDEPLIEEVLSLLRHTASSDSLPHVVPAHRPGVSLAGARLGVYQIDSPIGAGGMGVVYRARDTRLGRDVAVKVLPRAFSGDADRIARFEREARVLASLNHPHIATIHGIEDADGSPAIVMELIDGETLANRLARLRAKGRTLPLHETLAIAQQVADALAAAHEKSIVHRDLKPANIAITANHVVKVLDFGLAKTASTSHREPDDHTTLITAETGEGLIVGTAAYMSPEQARGQTVDKQTDVWAFGCVLYEMLTGRTAFAAGTVSDTIAAVLEREPDYQSLPAATPSPVRRLVQRCLRKERPKRLHDIADARLEIEDVIRGDSEDQHTVSSTARRSRAGAIAGTIAVLAIVSVGTVAWLYRPSSADRTPFRLTRLTYNSSLTMTPAISPDGRLLAYASDRAGGSDLDIWVQQIDGGVPLRLTDDPADDTTPEFSPDGKELAFRSERGGGGIFLVPVLGGPARLLVPGGRRPRFSPDGSHVAYEGGQYRGTTSSSQGSLHVLDLKSGTSRRLLQNFAAVRAPVWSPDGKALLVIARRDLTSPLNESFDWWWVPLEHGEPNRTGVLDTPGLRDLEPEPASWTADGVIFSDGQNLKSVTITPSTGRVRGPMRTLAVGSGNYVHPTSSRTGSIAFAAVTRERVIARVPVDTPTANASPAVRLHADGQDGAYRASVTSDGTKMVFEQQVNAEREIWLKTLPGGAPQLLQHVPATHELNATVSPDGSRVAYTVGQTDSVGRGFVVSTEGGLPQMVCEGCVLYGFLADNRRVLAQANGLHALRVYDLDGSFHDLVTSPDGVLNRPHVSPDDRWLAFRRTADVTSRTYVIPFPHGSSVPAAKWNAIEEPTTTGRPAGWSLDARRLYLLLDADGFRCLWAQRVDGTTGRPVGVPSPIHHFHGSQLAMSGGVSTTFGNAISAAGFTYESVDIRSDIWQLTRESR